MYNVLHSTMTNVHWAIKNSYIANHITIEQHMLYMQPKFIALFITV